LSLEPVKLKASAELMVYRLVQEALTNVAKYASATRVDIELGTEEGQVEVSVADNGVGFDTRTRSAGHGLLGMRYRVESEGGRMSVESQPGKGTRLDARLPEHVVAAAAAPREKDAAAPPTTSDIRRSAA
jgi:signal transduction histidine kinase